MSTPYLGMISLFAFNFPPKGWAFCNGQVMSIAQNSALYALIGTTYGGDGQNTFALPDLRGRVPNHQGQGPGLSNYAIGQAGGSETVVLNVNQLPAHTHTMTPNLQGTVAAKSGAGNSRSPVGSVPAAEAAGVTATYSTGLADGSMASGGVSITGTVTAANTGGGAAVPIHDPYLTMSYCIALQGVFPSQN